MGLVLYTAQPLNELLVKDRWVASTCTTACHSHVFHSLGTTSGKAYESCLSPDANCCRARSSRCPAWSTPFSFLAHKHKHSTLSEVSPLLLVRYPQLKASRVEQFFEELRRSRSRTISLALVRQLSAAAAAAIGAISEEQAAAIEAAEAAGGGGGLAEFIAQHRNRIGLSTPQVRMRRTAFLYMMLYIQCAGLGGSVMLH